MPLPTPILIGTVYLNIFTTSTVAVTLCITYRSLLPVLCYYLNKLTGAHLPMGDSIQSFIYMSVLGLITRGSHHSNAGQPMVHGTT